MQGRSMNLSGDLNTIQINDTPRAAAGPSLFRHRTEPRTSSARRTAPDPRGGQAPGVRFRSGRHDSSRLLFLIWFVLHKVCQRYELLARRLHLPLELLRYVKGAALPA